jgi:hypothetical protein
MVADRIVAGDAEKSAGGHGPDQLLGGKVEVPRSKPGSLDSEPKAFVAYEVIG